MDDGLEVVALLSLHSQLVALNLGLDLGLHVANVLRELAGGLLVDALVEGEVRS